MIFLHDAIQNGNSDRGIANPCMPRLNGKLAGHDGSPGGRAVIDYVRQVSTSLCTYSCHAPIVQEKDFGLGKLNEPFTSLHTSRANASRCISR